MNAQDYERLTLSLEDSPANPFPWLESKKVKGTTVTSGRKCSGLSENLSRVGYLVRTYLESCELPGAQFVRTWSVRDTLSPYLILKLRLSERRTDGSGCSLLPTPTATIADHGGPNQRDSSGRPGLQAAAKLWPTPTARNGKGPSNTDTRQGAPDLQTVVSLWATPTTRDYKSSDNNPMSTRFQKKSELNSQVGGQLNPTWVEWLLGFPPGWTDLSA